jgi:anaerobic selenocysteine-containing dehydrogenase
MVRIRTTCTLDCPDTCSIIAEVEDGRPLRLKGDPDHPVTAGFLCGKVASGYLDRYNSPDRLAHPLRRVGARGEGRRERIGWDEALDLVAARIRATVDRHGSLAVLDYGRAGSHSVLKLLNRRFFNLLGGVTTTCGSLCIGAIQAAQTADFGARQPHDWQDLAHSRAVLVWGRDPAKSHIHLLPFLRQARARGAPLVLVEPFLTQTAAFVDLHLRPRPGTDGYLAIGMAKHLFAKGWVDQEFLRRHVANAGAYRALLDGYSMDQASRLCGVPVAEIERAAELYGTRPPAAILAGYGVNNYRRGAQAYRLIDALAAITGNVGRPGGGVSHGRGLYDVKAFLAADIEGHALARASRALPQPTIGQAILDAQDPPIKLIVVTGANPVAQSPNAPKVMRAFGSAEFLVVVEQFMTDTAKLADVVLPTTTFLEEEDMIGSGGHRFLGIVQPVAPRRGEARTDLEIFQGLAERLGFGAELAGSAGEWLDRLLAPLAGRGIARDALRAGAAELPLPAVPYADGRFGTPSGRIELLAAFPAEAEPAGDGLRLLTTHTKRWLNSQAMPEDQPGTPAVAVHPEDLAAHGLAAGTDVLVRSRVGALRARAAADARVPRGCAMIPQGGWIGRGHGINLLTEDVTTEDAIMAAYYETRVRLEPAPGPAGEPAPPA